MKNILYSFLVLLLSSFVLDRILYYAGIYDTSPLIADEEHGFLLRKDHKNVSHSEGFYIGKNNSYGNLGPNYGYDKSDGTLRVGLMGSSFVKGNHVFERDHFRSLLEQELNIRNVDAEVLNFGRVRFSFQDMYVYYKQYVSNYDIDTVFFFLDEPTLKNKGNASNLPGVSYLSGSIVIDDSFKDKNEYKMYTYIEPMLHYSPIAWMFVRNIVMSNKNKLKEIVFDKFYNSDATKGFLKSSDVDNLVISPGQLHMLEEIFLEKRNNIIVLRQPISALEERLQSNEIVYIKLYESLDKIEASGIDPYARGNGKRGHWNYDGHSVVYKSLMNYIASAGEPK